jgi:hypothetical protein
MLFILLGLNIYCCVILCVLMWLVVMHGKYSYSCVIFLFCNMFYCTTNWCGDYFFLAIYAKTFEQINQSRHYFINFIIKSITQTNKILTIVCRTISTIFGFFKNKEKKGVIVHFQVIFLHKKRKNHFKANSPSFYNKMIVSNNY